MAGKDKNKVSKTSNGERPNVASWGKKAVRRDREPLDIMIAKLKAFKRGKKVYITVPNENPNETNKPFKRVEAKHIFGDFRTFGQVQLKKES